MATRQLRLVDVPVRRPPLARLKEALRSYWSGPITSSSPELARFFGGSSSAAGMPVTELTALTYSAVWAAVSLIADDISSLPLMLYKRLPGGGKDCFETHLLYRLLHEAPNPEQSSMQWRRTMQVHTLLWGNGYSEIERDGANRPVAIWPLTPDWVAPYRASSRAPLQYRVSNDRGSTLIDNTDMLVLPNLSYDGITGVRVIEQMRESIGLSLAAERYGAYAFGNGLSFGGVITYEGNPADEVKKNNREVLERRHMGIENARKLLALYGGAKFQATTTSPHDAQFQELRTFQVREVCRWFKLPPHKLANLADATFSNVEQQNLDYYTSCLRPWLELWEQELGRKLIASTERNIQFVEHVADGLLRADAAGRGDFYSKQFSVAGITPNEIRNAENRSPLAGGDRAYVPLNMIPMDRVDEYIDSLIKKAEPPPAAPAPAPAPDAPKVRELEETLRVALTRAETVEAVIGELREQLKAGAEVQATLTTAALEARAAQEQADAARARAETALDEAYTLVGTRTEDVDRLTGRVAAARTAVHAVLVHSVQHLLVREADRARKAQGSPERFAKWLETFYALHADFCRTALRPALKAWTAVEGRLEPLEALLDRMVAGHVGDSERQLRALLQDGITDGLGVPLEAVLRRWETERAEATVERFIREAV